MSSPEIVCLGEKPRTEASAWSLTDNKDTEFSFAWAIKNFSRKMESYDNGRGLASGVFAIKVEGLETSWRLECYPNGHKEDSIEAVSLFLKCTDVTPLKTLKRQLTYTLDFVIVDGNWHWNKKKPSTKSCTDNAWADGWGYHKFVTHEKLKSDKSKLLPQDCFEVYCVMKFDGPEVTTSGAISPTNHLLEPKEVNGEACSSCSGLVDLLETGVLSDVELVCEGRKFSCHKAILANKSTVFMATFCNKMEEATGQIDIQGIDPDTVKDMLNHIYGGEIDGLEDKAEELLVAADKYDLMQLKKSCEKMLAKSLNIGNCMDCLILADRHSPDTLKPTVIKFIVENFLEVVALDNWMEKLNNFSKVFQEVFDELASLRSYKNKNKETNNCDKKEE